MDRNAHVLALLDDHNVALRKESVDRNIKASAEQHERMGSLSARRAWIEIHLLIFSASRAPVALRKESVDRNCKGG